MVPFMDENMIPVMVAIRYGGVMGSPPGDHQILAEGLMSPSDLDSLSHELRHLSRLDGSDHGLFAVERHEFEQDWGAASAMAEILLSLGTSIAASVVYDYVKRRMRERSPRRQPYDRTLTEQEVEHLCRGRIQMYRGFGLPADLIKLSVTHSDDGAIEMSFLAPSESTTYEVRAELVGWGPVAHITKKTVQHNTPVHEEGSHTTTAQHEDS